GGGFVVAPSVDGHHHALRSELGCQLGGELWSADRRRVHRHLVGTGPQQSTSVVDRPDASPDGEGDEDVFGYVASQFDDGVALVGRCGDVEEHELVGAFEVVAGRQLHRIASVAQIDEVRALDDPTGVDVEAGDHPRGAHCSTSTADPTGTVPS